MTYFVYILKCADESFYTGLTRNLENRITQHETRGGARFTKNKLPIELVCCEKFENKFTAAKREKEIKGWRREKKIELMKVYAERNESEAKRA